MSAAREAAERIITLIGKTNWTEQSDVAVVSRAYLSAFSGGKDNIADEIRRVLNGYPYATMDWPLELLSRAAVTVNLLQDEVDQLKALGSGKMGT